jgi:hypothetical protein
MGEAVNSESKTLQELFEQADRVGKKRYHRLTQQDFDDYRKYDYWRYVSGDGECGTTQQSKDWVSENSDLRRTFWRSGRQNDRSQVAAIAVPLAVAGFQKPVGDLPDVQSRKGRNALV